AALRTWPTGRSDSAGRALHVSDHVKCPAPRTDRESPSKVDCHSLRTHLVAEAHDDRRGGRRPARGYDRRPSSCPPDNALIRRFRSMPQYLLSAWHDEDYGVDFSTP